MKLQEIAYSKDNGYISIYDGYASGFMPPMAINMMATG